MPDPTPSQPTPPALTPQEQEAQEMAFAGRVITGIVDWCIRILLLAFLIYWAVTTWQLHDALAKAKKDAEIRKDK